ncbi:hypothetical protein H4I95_09555 [Botrytis cinerea]
MSERHSIRSEDEPAWSPKDVEESLLHEEINGPERGAKNFHHSYLEYNAAYLIISFFLGALFTFIILSLALSRKRFDSKSDDIQWIQNTKLKDLVSAPKSNLRFDGTLDRSSPYKGPPSPEVDALWDEIKMLGAMNISEDVFQHLNASKYAVKLPSSLGGGRLALFETIRQLHCNAAYPEYYTEQTKFKNSHLETWYGHLDHCADVLRQKLMCDADTDIVTYNWLKGKVNPNPNFNVQHQCRNFDAILDYARDNQVDKDDTDRIDVDLLKPENGNIMEFEGEPPFDSDAVPSMRQE